MFINSKLSPYRVRKIVDLFCNDYTATEVAKEKNLTRKTVNLYYWNFRRLVSESWVLEATVREGFSNNDLSVLPQIKWPGQKKWKTNISKKQTVFGVFEHAGNIYVEIIPREVVRDYKNHIRGNFYGIERYLEGTGHRESILLRYNVWLGYDGLIDMKEGVCICTNEKKGEIAIEDCPNVITAFWIFSKKRLGKFNGLSQKYSLHLTECAWRYGKTCQQLTDELLCMIRENPILKSVNRN